MSDKKPKKGRLSAQDIEIWKQMTVDVKRADGRDYLDVLDVPAFVEATDAAMVFETVLPRSVQEFSPDGYRDMQGVELDRRTAERLRKGQIGPEAYLDLHGMGQGTAREALHDFITASHARGLRCVLVITGKGRAGQRTDEGADWQRVPVGVLKQRVPEWLREGVAASRVLQFCAAQPKDGGDGALYVYLRRTR
jgi:DNA-nicking Smr family endonuclease